MRGLILIALSLPSFAQSQVLPAAPQVTVGASQLKVLQFNWSAVPGATHYLLQYKPNASSTFAPHGNPIPAPRAIASLTIPVHAFDWVNARFKVSACNAVGCQDSAELSVQNLMLTSIGYFKASNTDRGDGFGRAAQLSQDGNTLIVAAVDDSNATGVNGRQGDNSSEDSGAVYVFRRIGAGWRQTAYLKPSVNFPEQSFGLSSGRALSVSADGSLIAVGAPGEERNGIQFVGAVYLFSRAADGTWSQTERFTLPAPAVYDFFGESVDLSSDGLYLKVSAFNPRDEQDRSMGYTYIYYHGATGWFQYALLVPDQDDFYCSSQMSGNTSAIISVCDSVVNGPHLRARRRAGAAWNRVQDIPLPSNLSQIPALSGNGARLAIRVINAAGHFEVLVYGWTGSAWTQEAALESPGGADTDYPAFGQGLALNRNGTVLAVGDTSNTASGAGVSDSVQPPLPRPPLNRHGAVFVYQRGDGTPRWTLTKVVKATNPENDDAFGVEISLSGSGLTMAVDAGAEDSAARGIDGNQADNSKTTSGAVYLY